MISRRDRLYAQYPEITTGYELSPEKSMFSVIIPEATTNLCTNPSVEGAVTTGYAALGGAMAAVSTWQAYGSYGLRLTPAVSTESGFYYGTIALAAGTTYTFSMVVQGEAGKLYYIWFATSAGALIGTKQPWRGTGHKQVVQVTYAETTNASRRFYITRDAQYTDQNVFYADGLQVEEKSYRTTFCDGDQIGFVIGETPYLWTGTPGASTSTRSAQTRSGGREVNLLDLGIRVLAVIGLGMMPLVDQSLSIPGYGELAQGTGTKAREFTLVSAIDAEAGGRQLSAILSTITDAFKPDLTVKDQPLILRYQQLDDDAEPCGESMDIICKYRSGLEGPLDNLHSVRAPITFKQYIPYIKATYDTGTTLGYQTTVANANGIIKRGTDGVWAAMGTGIHSGGALVIYTIAHGPNGSVYIGGLFSDAGGVANTAFIAAWNGSAWSALGTGADDAVRKIIFDAAGNLYACGDFTSMGGVANTARIAKWNGAVWSALSTGANGAIWDIAINPLDGYLYATGQFSTIGGVAAAGIAKWDGAAWVALGAGLTGGISPTGRSLAFNKNGDVFVGGTFTTADGVTCANVAEWTVTITGSTFVALGSGITGDVYSLIISDDGNLFAGGQFTVAGGVSALRIAQWNGVIWSAVGLGITTGTVIYSMYSANFTLVVAGDFTVAGGVPTPDSIAFYNNSVWLPVDINLPGAPTARAVMSDPLGNLYVGFDTAGSATSATVTASISGNSKAYPIITFTGPGTLYQLKDYTTGKSIFFNLTLLAGETAVLNLDPTHLSFVSSFRGNIYGTAILPGSNLNWELMPGSNNVSAFMYGSTAAATAITMRWSDQYNSQDGAVWK